MNILIIGEFSGFAKHLKNGFLGLGHKVTVVQNGDGWKKLGSPDDIMLEEKNFKIWGKTIHGSNRIMTLFINHKVHKQIKKQCPHPSLIIVINYTFLQEDFTKVGVSKRYIKYCMAKGAKMIMCECGNSCAGAYNNPAYYKQIGSKTEINDARFKFLLKECDVVVPTSFCYYDDIMAYSKAFEYDYSKISRCIPLPITIDDNYYISSCEKRKIVVFHGVIRPVNKGTEYIKEAMNRLQKDYPERVECVCKGGIPYNEYLKLFERVDILIDQCRLNGWGINAEIGAMKGKCVLTSCGVENAENMCINDIPFIQIIPDSEQIYQVLKFLIMHPNVIDQTKLACRKFAEKYCDCKTVSQRYLDIVGL